MNLRACFVPIGLGTALLWSCDRPPVVRNCDPEAAVQCPNLNDPAGRIEGTLIYQGPPPLRDANGQATGRIVLLLFDYANPPAPQGTATTAITFQSVSAAELFANAMPIPGGNVRAALAYSFPGIPAAGEYQLRAFYSRADSITYDPGTGGSVVTAPSGFHPLFSVRNLPVLGDVGGGAIVDPNASIPSFTRIPIGTPTGVDADGNTTYTLPTEGFVASNVSVFLGSVFTTDRPMFNVQTDMTAMDAPAHLTLDSVAPPPTGPDTTQSGPEAPPLPGPALADYARLTGLLPTGSPVLELQRNYVIQHPDTGADLPAFTLHPSFVQNGSTDECLTAARGGVLCATTPAATIGFFESAYDRNQNGTIDITVSATPPFADAHPTLLTTSAFAAPTNGHVPWVYPLVIFSRLHEPTDIERAQLIQGQQGHLTPAMWETLRASLNKPETFDPSTGRYPVLFFGTVLPSGSAAGLLLRPWTQGYTTSEPTVRVGIIPIAVEIHGNNPLTDWYAILPPGTPDLISLATPFLPPHYSCWDYSADPMYNTPFYPDQAGIPEGRYAINVINQAGQAWTVPNELAAFDGPGCPASGCQAVSQSLVLRVTGANPPPDGVMVTCPDPEYR